MGKIVYWIKNNKISTLLLLAVTYLLLFKNSPVFPLSQSPALPAERNTLMKTVPAAIEGVDLNNFSSVNQAAPALDIKNRLVAKESYLSLLVNNVTQTQKQIIQTAEQYGGYMVNSNLSNPQDAPTATVIVRLPAKKLSEALDRFRQMSIKIISENLSGQDVTDQYIDNEARLQTLLKTKAKFEQILDQATKVEDILNVQRELINLQSQIDSLRGQQNYLEKSAQMAKLTIYLATDELALPYTPSESWRPTVIFKQAVRSLISNLRKAGTFLIWLIVYSVIWLPAALAIYFLRRKKSSFKN